MVYFRGKELVPTKVVNGAVIVPKLIIPPATKAIPRSLVKSAKFKIELGKKPNPNTVGSPIGLTVLSLAVNQYLSGKPTQIAVLAVNIPFTSIEALGPKIKPLELRNHKLVED